MQSSKPSIAKKDQQSTTNKGQTDISNLTEDSKDMTVSNVKLKTRSKSVVKAGTLKSRTDPKELAKVQIIEKPEVKKVLANKVPTSNPETKPVEVKIVNEKKPILLKQNVLAIQSSFKLLDTGDFEDPIAQALHARTNLGGTEKIVKETDARKLGVQLIKTVKLRELKGPDLIEIIIQSAVEKQSKIDVKAVTHSKAIAGQPGLNGDLSQDPIAQCFADRYSLGGFTFSLSVVDAKKRGFSVPKLIKHLAKGKEEVVLIADPPVQHKKPNQFENDKADKSEKQPAIKQSENKLVALQQKKELPSAASQAENKQVAAPQKKDQSAATSYAKALPSGHTGLNGDLSQDPIAQCFVDRWNCGGFTFSLSELDAKKRGFSLPKSIKHLAKGKEEVVLIQDPPKEETKKQTLSEKPKDALKPVAVAKNLKQKTDKPEADTTDVLNESSEIIPEKVQPIKELKDKPVAVKQARKSGMLKPNKLVGIEKLVSEPEANDPLDVSLHARKKNNGEPIAEADARKQKLPIPKPLKHKITGGEHIELITNKEDLKVEIKSKPTEIKKVTEKVAKVVDKKQDKEDELKMDPKKADVKHSQQKDKKAADKKAKAEVVTKPPPALKKVQKGQNKQIDSTAAKTVAFQTSLGSPAPQSDTTNPEENKDSSTLDENEKLDFTSQNDQSSFINKGDQSVDEILKKNDDLGENEFGEISPRQFEEVQVEDLLINEKEEFDLKGEAHKQELDEDKLQQNNGEIKEEGVSKAVQEEEEQQRKAAAEAEQLRLQADDEAKRIQQEIERRITEQEAIDERNRFAQQIEEKERLSKIQEAEATSRAENEKKQEETARVEQEQKNAEEQNNKKVALIAEEQSEAEATRAAEEQTKAEAAHVVNELKKAETARVADEKKKAEAVLVAEEQRKAEAARIEEELKKAEETRIAEEKIKAEAARVADEKKKAEAARVAEEQRKAEAARIEEELKKAEETRIAEEKIKAEAARVADEQKMAEAARVADEQQKAEAARVADEQQKAEAARIAEEQRKVEAARMADEQQKAESARIAEEQRKAEAARIEEEERKIEAIRVVEEQRKAEAARVAEEQRLIALEQQRIVDEESVLVQNQAVQQFTEYDEQYQNDEYDQENELDFQHEDPPDSFRNFQGNDELAGLDQEQYSQRSLNQGCDIIEVDDTQTPRLNIDMSHVVTSEVEQNNLIEETKELVPQKIVAQTRAEIDVTVIKAVWPYLRPQQAIPADSRLKLSFELVKDLYDELCKKIDQNKAKKDKILKEQPSCTSEKLNAFKIQEATMNSLQILEDIPCDYSDWVDTESKNDWVARTLKLFYFSQKNFSRIYPWARWPEIVHMPDETFFEKASKQIEDNVDELEQFLVDKCKEMDLENMSAEQMARIECLVEHLGGIKMCDPHADYVDSSVCQFVMFVMRDVLKYLGLTQQRVPSQEYRICVYKETFFQDMKTALEKIIG